MVTPTSNPLNLSNNPINSAAPIAHASSLAAVVDAADVTLERVCALRPTVTVTQTFALHVARTIYPWVNPTVSA